MATTHIVRQDGKDFKSLTQDGAREFQKLTKAALIDHIDDLYAEAGELADKLEERRIAWPKMAQLLQTYYADLHRPVANLAERLARHSDFLRPGAPDNCLYDRTIMAATDLGRRGDEYQLENEAKHFLQVLDYTIESRGWNPEAVLRLVESEIRDRLEWGDW